MYSVCKETFFLIPAIEPKWRIENQKEIVVFIFVLLWHPKKNCCKETLQSDPKPVYYSSLYKKKEKAHMDSIQGLSRPEQNFFTIMNKPTHLDFKVMGVYCFCIFFSFLFLFCLLFCFWGTGQCMYLTLRLLPIMWNDWMTRAVAFWFIFSTFCKAPHSPAYFVWIKAHTTWQQCSLNQLYIQLATNLELKLPLQFDKHPSAFSCYWDAASTALWSHNWDMVAHTQLMTH